MLNEKQQEELIDLAKELIDCQSYTGQEQDISELVKQRMLDLGFDDADIDEMGNVVGVIRGNLLGPRILFDAHLDTVEAENLEDWHYYPFKAQVVDDRLVGRGATDMKGSLAAMMVAASHVDRSSLKGEIYISGTVHEEIAEGVAIRNVLTWVKPDLVVIGESSQLDVCLGQRGRAEVVLDVLGESAHSANPEAGINAVLKMMPALKRLEDVAPPKDDVLGEGILVLTDIVSSPYPGCSVIPRICRATFDRRLLPGETREDVLERIRGALEPLTLEDPQFSYELFLAENNFTTWTDYEVSCDRFAPAWKYDPEEKWIVRTVDILREAGVDAELSSYSFCTNGSGSAGEMGYRTLGFGPGMENRAHTADEYILLDQLYQGCWGYWQLMENLGTDSKVFMDY